jgi:uncharacterized membrane protein/CBS domain-containing protein
MKRSITLLGAFGVGAGLMYLLDPDKGKRRRALTRDWAMHVTKAAERQARKMAHDLGNRSNGTLSEFRSVFTRHEEVSDERLGSRVRAALGRFTSHPHAINTSVEDGWVIVSGPILEDEADVLLKNLSRIKGVKTIEDRLERHSADEKVAALQNGKKKNTQNLHWSPFTRLLATTAGAGITVFAVRKGGVLGQAAATVGMGLLTRGITDTSLKSLAKGNGGFRIQKSIKIKAPVETVFHLCSRPENFPEFMSHVRSVEKIGEREYRWSVDGVPGFPLTWETRVTTIEPNSKIVWESLEGASVNQRGQLHFEKLVRGSTRLSVDMRYTPPGGTLGHATAAFFGRDPKSEMDDDLLRMKCFIEKGITPHDAASRIQMKGDKAMKVSEIMTKDPTYCVPTTGLKDVAQMMLEHDCGAIPVIENPETKKPVGVVTDRDITIDTVAHGKNPLHMTAGEIMTFPVLTVTPDTSVDDCCTKMEDNMVRRMVVVDQNGSCCGIVAQADIARNAPQFETAELVKDISMMARAAG